MKKKEIVPAVLAIIKNGDKFLLTKRHIKSRFEGGKWGFIGEAMKYGEQPEDTLRRGIKEETNLDLKSWEFIDLGSFMFESEDKDRHAVLLIYICEVEGDVELNHEAEDFGWFGIDEIEDLDLIKGNDKIVPKLKTKL